MVPGQQQPLGERYEREQRDPDHREEEDRGEHRRCVGCVVEDQDQVPEALGAPTHSPKTAPITDSAAAIFSPLNRNGNEAGNWA